MLDGASGAELPGFPTHTNPLPIHASPAYASGEVPLPHEAVIGYTGQRNEFKTSSTLAGIEWGLRLPPHPIAELVPLQERFTGAAHQLEIRATICAATNTACNRNQAAFRLWLGDSLIDFDPAGAIRSWSLGIAAF